MGQITITNPSDGQVITAASVNTPLNTIVAVINGNLDSTNLATGAVGTAQLQDSSVTTAKHADSSVTTAKILDAAVTATKLGLTITTSTGNTIDNGGGATATWQYINLGGIKIAWCNTPTTLPTNNGSTNFGVHIPSFFTTVTGVVASANIPGNSAKQYATVQAIATTVINVYITCDLNSSTCGIGLLVIGT